jgi:phospholipase C
MSKLRLLSGTLSLAIAAFPHTEATLANVSQIKHVVIIFQENRTPDNFFHGLQNYLPAADIANSGLNSKGQTITLTSVPLANGYDLSHTHAAFEEMYDGGRMDGADRIACLPTTGGCPSQPQYKYVQYSDVTPYFQIAINYGFANRMFQTNQGPSFPAHQFILSGTSAPDATSPDFAAENPNLGLSGYGNGCIADPAQTVNLIDPSGNESTAIYPCFEHGTLTDLLDGAQPPLSWRYYTLKTGTGPGWVWDAPLAIQHMCQPSASTASCAGPDFADKKVFMKPARILTDIRNGRLPAVSWVIPTGRESDHAGSNDGSGPSWVASIVNAVGGSSYWPDTVILITWDDWGGWYDHVVPPIDPTYGYYEYGFRVPLLVVSAYTPAGYVSPTPHDFGSILKFIETAFGLPLIPPGTFADARADDLSDFFDFSQPARQFVPISAPISAAYFLNDPRPVTAPDDDQ